MLFYPEESRRGKSISNTRTLFFQRRERKGRSSAGRKYQFLRDWQPTQPSHGRGSAVARILRFPCPLKAVGCPHARSHPEAACGHRWETRECTIDFLKAVYWLRCTITRYSGNSNDDSVAPSFRVHRCFGWTHSKEPTRAVWVTSWHFSGVFKYAGIVYRRSHIEEEVRKYFTEAITTSVSSTEDDTGSEGYSEFSRAPWRGREGAVMLFIMGTIRSWSVLPN